MATSTRKIWGAFSSDRRTYAGRCRQSVVLFDASEGNGPGRLGVTLATEPSELISVADERRIS